MVLNQIGRFSFDSFKKISVKFELTVSRSILELEQSYLPKNWSEFCQKLIGNGISRQK